MSGRGLPARLLSVLAQALGPNPVALHEPVFSGREWDYVRECLDSGWVSSVGRYVDRFEADLASYTGARHAIAVVNGTAALHAALLLAGVQPGDEVLVPALTFVGTANAVAYCGATPHFVDSAPDTLGLDPAALADYLRDIADATADGCRNRRSGARIAAVVPVHVFGHPVALGALLETAERYNLPVVEDASEAIGSYYEGRHAGTFGRLGMLSFNGNKTITTGGGGAILTDDPELARRAKHITTTAKEPHRWAYLHDEVGFNYRLPNINAALGCAQLEQLDGFIDRKRRLTERLGAALAGMNGVTLVREPPRCRSNYWLQAILLDPSLVDKRDAVLEATNDAGYMTRPVWRLMHRLPMYAGCPRMPLAVAEDLERRLINLPSGMSLCSD